MAGDSALPTLRAATFAAVCVGLGAVMHTAVSHGSIPTSALLAGAIAVYTAARLATGRGERGLLAISGLMVASQVALDLLFSLAQHTPSISVGACRMPGITEPVLPAGTRIPVESAAARLDATLVMLIAHTLAAMACVFWLWRGEAALHAVIRCAAFRLRGVWFVVVFAAAPADRTPRRARVRSCARSLRSQWMRGILEQRGPPRPVLAF